MSEGRPELLVLLERIALALEARNQQPMQPAIRSVKKLDFYNAPKPESADDDQRPLQRPKSGARS